MTSSLVGKFIGLRPNLDVVRTYVRNKWDLKGHLDIVAMAKGFLSFEFSCIEDLKKIICVESWSFGCLMLALQKWTSKMDLNDSFFV